MKGQDRIAYQYKTRILLVGVPDALKHLKNEIHARKNEIGLNFGNKFAAPLLWLLKGSAQRAPFQRAPVENLNSSRILVEF